MPYVLTEEQVDCPIRTLDGVGMCFGEEGIKNVFELYVLDNRAQ